MGHGESLVDNLLLPVGPSWWFLLSCGRDQDLFTLTWADLTLMWVGLGHFYSRVGGLYSSVGRTGCTHVGVFYIYVVLILARAGPGGCCFFVFCFFKLSRGWGF